MKIDGLPVNFSISARAKEEIDTMRQYMNNRSPGSAAIPMIAWGDLIDDRTGKTAGCPCVGFYHQSQMPEVTRGIEKVSGVDVIFFITSRDYWRFENKILDFDPKRGFLLS